MGFLDRFRPFLTPAEKRRVAEAVARAEERSTGEICVHLTSIAPPHHIMDAAREVFERLGLHQTKRRNAVLILVATADRRFAIWGDEGIHAAAGQALWDRARAVLEKGLSEGRHAEALEACVAEVGDALARHFPRGESDVDELPNRVSED